ncbi:hypothetical protein PRZ48_014498 [Zasmidium cellare]|uniref:GPI anchored protein n=1 Tax=Zasmidium cellare TaxID=395010 RepID=A0ABR0DYX1_ZASCE|nr:hypothetical protein PRZ48_014498 [Zasmidium cellare]
MLFRNSLILGLAAVAIAQNDPQCDSDNDGDDDDNCSTTTGVDGVVLTTRMTSTDFGVSTTSVPVFTPIVSTTSDVDVNTNRETITETTDIGTTPTNTIVQVATTTDVNLESGYAYSTDDSGHTIAITTGTTMMPSSTNAAGAGNTNDNDNDDDDQDDNDSDNMASTTSSDSGSFATAAPYFGAAAMAGLAFVL